MFCFTINYYIIRSVIWETRLGHNIMAITGGPQESPTVVLALTLGLSSSEQRQPKRALSGSTCMAQWVKGLLQLWS